MGGLCQAMKNWEYEKFWARIARQIFAVSPTIPVYPHLLGGAHMPFCPPVEAMHAVTIMSLKAIGLQIIIWGGLAPLIPISVFCNAKRHNTCCGKQQFYIRYLGMCPNAGTPEYLKNCTGLKMTIIKLESSKKDQGCQWQAPTILSRGTIDLFLQTGLKMNCSTASKTKTTLKCQIMSC